MQKMDIVRTQTTLSASNSVLYRFVLLRPKSMKISMTPADNHQAMKVRISMINLITKTAALWWQFWPIHNPHVHLNSSFNVLRMEISFAPLNRNQRFPGHKAKPLLCAGTDTHQGLQRSTHANMSV